jgi:hypothetical protein
MTFVVFVLQSQNFDMQVNHKIVGLNSHFVQTEAIAVNEMYLFYLSVGLVLLTEKFPGLAVFF